MKYSLRRSLYAALLCSLFLSSSAYALFDKNLEKIAPVLRNNSSEYIEEYVARNLSIIRRYAKDKKALTAADIAEANNQARLSDVNRQLTQVIVYDLNQDSVVTKDEIREHLQKKDHPAYRTDDRLQEHINKLMMLDRDDDGKISYTEMSTLSETSSGGRSLRKLDELEDYLSLDPDQDGKLTVAELEKLSRDAFAIMDADGDGILSQEDREDLQALKRNSIQVPRSCILADVPSDALVLHIALKEGDVFSPVSIDGPTSLTTIADITVKKARQPLYLMLTSPSPVIWNIKGNSNDVIKAVIYGPARKGDKIAMGVIGLTQEKISFKDYKPCFASNLNVSEEKGDLRLRSIISQMTQKDDALISVAARAESITIDGKNIELAARSGSSRNPDAPPSQMFFGDTGPANRETAAIMPEAVVSQMQVIPYRTKHGMSGLQQLMNEGVLSRDKKPILIRAENEDTRSAYFVRITGSPQEQLKGLKNAYIVGIGNLYHVHKATDLPLGLTLGIVPHVFVVDKEIPPPKLGSMRGCVISGETLEIIEGRC